MRRVTHTNSVGRSESKLPNPPSAAVRPSRTGVPGAPSGPSSNTRGPSTFSNTRHRVTGSTANLRPAGDNAPLAQVQRRFLDHAARRSLRQGLSSITSQENKSTREVLRTWMDEHLIKYDSLDLGDDDEDSLSSRSSSPNRAHGQTKGSAAAGGGSGSRKELDAVVRLLTTGHRYRMHVSSHRWHYFKLPLRPHHWLLIRLEREVAPNATGLELVLCSSFPRTVDPNFDATVIASAHTTKCLYEYLVPAELMQSMGRSGQSYVYICVHTLSGFRITCSLHDLKDVPFPSFGENQKYQHRKQSSTEPVQVEPPRPTDPDFLYYYPALVDDPMDPFRAYGYNIQSRKGTEAGGSGGMFPPVHGHGKPPSSHNTRHKRSATSMVGSMLTAFKVANQFGLDPSLRSRNALAGFGSSGVGVAGIGKTNTTAQPTSLKAADRLRRMKMSLSSFRVRATQTAQEESVGEPGYAMGHLRTSGMPFWLWHRMQHRVRHLLPLTDRELRSRYQQIKVRRLQRNRLRKRMEARRNLRQYRMMRGHGGLQGGRGRRAGDREQGGSGGGSGGGGGGGGGRRRAHRSERARPSHRHHSREMHHALTDGDDGVVIGRGQQPRPAKINKSDGGRARVRGGSRLSPMPSRRGSVVSDTDLDIDGDELLAPDKGLGSALVVKVDSADGSDGARMANSSDGARVANSSEAHVAQVPTESERNAQLRMMLNHHKQHTHTAKTGAA